MGAPRGQRHAPAGSGSVGSSVDRSGKTIWRGRVTWEGKRHYSHAITRQPGMTDATARRLARRHLDALIDRLRRDEDVDAAKDRARLGLWLDQWLAATRAALPAETPSYGNYARIVERHVRPFLGHVRVGRVTSARVLAWREELAGAPDRLGGPRSVQTIKDAEALLRRILREAQAMGYPVSKTVEAMSLPKVGEREERPTITAAQLDGLCAAAPSPWSIAWRVAFYAGLRRGELAGLKWAHVLWPTAAIDLRAQRDRQGRDRAPKKGSSGLIFLPETAMAALREHLARATATGYPVELDDYVFLRKLGDRFAPLHYLAIHRAIKRDVVAAGLDGRAATHALRHGFAMATVQASTLPATRDQMRHKDIATTAVYTGHRDTEHQRRAAEALDG